MASGQAINRTIECFRLRVRLPQSELIMILFDWFELQFISEC